jgi:phenylpropionate dioxygenase-like ring-hydroxylating dioxygenase large terminal subunit
MRQYWLPLLSSAELPEADGAPVRVRLLGEDLIAFRTTSGTVGLVENSCPHRGASLFYARNEEEGLTCVYHGWKFGVDGACLAMPTEPVENGFIERVRAVTYPCVERNGVIWTYMGSREVPPPLPDLEPNLVAGEGYQVRQILRRCNWVQALEGDVDTSHFGFLHRNLQADPKPGTFEDYMERERAPKYAVADTEFGVSYGAYRPAEEDSYYWRIAHFLFPFYTMIPTGVLGVQVLVRAWVPLDDNHTMFWHFMPPASTEDEHADPETQRQRARSAAAIDFDYLPNDSSFLGRWRLRDDEANDYGIDRDSQRTRSYTGIDRGGAFLQDQAVTESMGPIYDRRKEHLGTSDMMVIRTRSRLINAAKALREHGVLPPGVDNPAVYRTRSGGIVLPREADWLAAIEEKRQPALKVAVET